MHISSRMYFIARRNVPSISAQPFSLRLSSQALTVKNLLSFFILAEKEAACIT